MGRGDSCLHIVCVRPQQCICSHGISRRSTFGAEFSFVYMCRAVFFSYAVLGSSSPTARGVVRDAEREVRTNFQQALKCVSDIVTHENWGRSQRRERLPTLSLCSLIVLICVVFNFVHTTYEFDITTSSSMFSEPISKFGLMYVHLLMQGRRKPKVRFLFTHSKIL